MTDPDGRTTTVTFNWMSHPTGEDEANGGTTPTAYNSEGFPVSETDAMSRTFDFTYDSEGDITSITEPNIGGGLMGGGGTTETVSYNALGLVSGESEPVRVDEGFGYYYTYEEPVATLAYNQDGDLITETDGDDHKTSYTYNDLNELTEVENSDGDTTEYTYDDDGNVLTVTDGLGHTETYTYNDMGQVLTDTQPSGGGTTTYAYDEAGRIVSLEDPDDNITTYGYNGANEVVTEESPTGGLTTMTYDLDGDVLSTIDPDGHEITYSYDADNELTGETWVNPEGGTPLDVFDFTYNADGELTAASDDNSAYQYTYNADGEETSQADVGSPDLPTVTLTYEYDADGNRTSMDDSLGGLVSYTYNARDELTNETLSGTDISAIAVANTYDNAGNMTGQTRYSNTAETDVVATTSYTYDDAEQMTGITDKNSGGTTLVSYGYTYDAAGLVSQETRTWDSGSDTDTLDYTYTNNDQLTGVTHTDDSFASESFSYDANGNETGTGFTTSTGNEQTASPGYTYTDDADGNMITSTDTSTGDTWTYSYNFAGQMTGAVEKSSDDTIVAQATYTYDALGNRIGMDEDGTQTWTLYDGSDPVMDFNGSGSLEMRYLNGPTGDLVDSVIARESSGGTVAWYLPDRLGTIRDLISNSGAIIDHVDYSAFGTVLDESDPSEGDRMMGFAGMERDTVTGMSLAVYRVQDPGTGRWTSEDPMGFAAGDANLLQYANNDPVMAGDPLGLQDSMKGQAKGPTLTQRRMKALRDMINVLKQALAELNYSCSNAAGSPLPPPLDFLRPKLGGNSDLYAGTSPPWRGGGTYVPWESGLGTLFPDGDTYGNFANHGYYVGGGSPLMGGNPFPTYFYNKYWGQNLIGQATTLLHEAYHAHGYWASQSGFDYADHWAGKWIPCIQATNAWKKFFTPQNQNRYKALFR